MKQASTAITTELQDRELHREKIAALFRLHPLEDISADTLKSITPHYQQRISECRRKLEMTIRNVPVTVRIEPGGRLKRLDGSYRFEPFERLGRDANAGQVVAAGWSTKHGRPFEQPFELKP